MENIQKYNIVNIANEEDDEIFDTVDKVTEEKLLVRRRYLKLSSIIIVFIICFFLLAMSILYDVHHRDIPDEDG